MTTRVPDIESPQKATDHLPVATYVPHWLVRSERFIWQQVRDGDDVTVLTRELLPTADEFPVDRLTLLKPRAAALRSLDFRAAKLGRRVGADLTLPPLETARAAIALRRMGVVYVMFLWNALEIAGAARLARTPLVVHAAGSDVTTARDRGRDYLDRVRGVFDQANLILCGSRFLRERVLELGAPEDRCRVHYLGIDVPPPTERVNSTGSSSVLLVSRLHPVKGVDRSIRAFAAGLADAPASLTVVGDGPERNRLEALVDELGIGGRVTFTGELAHDDVYDQMAAADIFIQHNVTGEDGGAEGLGGTLLEAAAHDLPVVATRSGGVPEAVVDGETGYLVPEDDVDAMAERLRSLAAAPERRAEMGRAGRAFVERVHDSRTQNRRLAALLAEVSA